MPAPLIALYTDFGYAGPYVGQMHLACAAAAPGVPVVDLMHDAPTFAPKPAAYLLAQLVAGMPSEAVVCAVVDPGVGGDRPPVALRADDRWLVGPGNGLLEVAARRAGRATWFRIAWRPPRLSASFHGRDLFAPVAGRLAADPADAVAGLLAEDVTDGAQMAAAWPDDLPEIVYVDAYGNAVTGVRARAAGDAAGLRLGDRLVPRRRTFSDVSTGMAFCYENSMGLLEIAVNQGSAAEALGLGIGDAVAVSAE